MPTSVEYGLEERKKRIEDCLDALIPELESKHQSLYSAARYSLLAGGKRLRPLLALTTAECLGGKQSLALVPACAIELIHCYSLIHDDLPCMDDDDFRRQKPTLHRVTTEAHAILAGDYLLTHAFQVLAEAPGLSPEQRLKLIETLARASGGEGMVGGQILDIESEGKEIDLATLQLIHSKKTGALLRASLEFGGIIANASPEQMTILRRLGELLGIAFQIVDDILDVTDIQAKRGGDSVSDLVNDKVTYPKLMGIERAQEQAASAIDAAHKHLDLLTGDTAELRALTDLVLLRSN